MPIPDDDAQADPGPTDPGPTDNALEFFASSLATEDLARYYGRTLDKIAGMEDSLGQERRHLARVRFALNRRLRAEVGTHSLEVDRYLYRAHRDGCGVHRERIAAGTPGAAKGGGPR